MGVRNVLGPIGEPTLLGQIFKQREKRKEAQMQRGEATARAAAAEEKRRQAEEQAKQSVMLQKERARKRTLFAGDPEQENNLFRRTAFGNNNRLGS